MPLGKLQQEPLYTRAAVENASELNQQLRRAFLREHQGEHARHSHLELGRYENTYIEQDAVPEVDALVAAALSGARQILQVENLKYGFWFNAMEPGDKTARHNHDEEDELLSCVYYVTAPPDCGDLILFEPWGHMAVSPIEGHLLYFSPNLAHAVEENRSGQQRLSIAFNFGRVES